MNADAKVPPARLVRIIDRVRHLLSRFDQRLVPPPAAIIDLFIGGWVAQAVQAAAVLGIADALAGGPLRLPELSERVGADQDGLSRLMRALISRGIFRQRRDGRYDLTPLAAPLRSDVPDSMVGTAMFYGSAQHRAFWTHLVDSVRTGRPVVEPLHGKEFFDYLADEPALGSLFNAAMTGVSELAVGPVVSGYDFSRFQTIVDVGGGHGSLLAAIVNATPGARGVLYDLPEVVADAPNHLVQRGVTDRIRVDSGSFFDSVPDGGDAYLLKHIIHDWADDQALVILRNIHAAAGPGATLLLLEMVIPEHDRAFSGKWVDLEMMLVVGGRERTAAQYRSLLAQAGFRLDRVVETASPFSFVEATAV